jgi:hypothetical protein
VIVGMIAAAVAIVLIWIGVARPSGLTRASRELRRAQDAETHRQMVQAMECSVGLCAHMVNGRHPQLMVTQQGKRYWRLDTVMWEEGTPCPIQQTAPGADAP